MKTRKVSNRLDRGGLSVSVIQVVKGHGLKSRLCPPRMGDATKILSSSGTVDVSQAIGRSVFA